MPCKVVLDRVLDGDYFAARGVYLAQKGVERRRFARAGGAGGEDHAVGFLISFSIQAQFLLKPSSSSGTPIALGLRIRSTSVSA
jgi:hypothetical protein